MKKSTRSQSLLQLPIFCFLLLHDSLVRSASSFKSVGILLNCGDSFDSVDANKRLWINDSNTLFGPSNSHSSFFAKASEADLSEIPSAVPYQNARIFTSTSFYNFTTLTEGRHFIRLHFFTAVYGDWEPKNAFFSVAAGPYTLLSNFSPAITASTLTRAYFTREFFITVPSGFLTLTFTPSPSTPDSFAFINGIEIVSSPELYFSGPFNSSSIVGINQKFPIRDSDALQTIVRLNVGGSTVSPASDSGLFRSWDDDIPYIFGAGFGVSYFHDPNVSIQYSEAIPEYIAPPDVYGTARSMGPNGHVNLNYNLTWLITVDNGFRYLIRLHFCEIQTEFYKVNQRVFYVYVNNMTADEVDVIVNAQKKVQAPIYTGVAVYKDYMVIVPRKMQSGEQSDLWIELHPTDTSQYDDAILNGLEVFKLNETSGNLAGPNPDLPPAATPDKSNTPPSHRQGVVHGLVIAGITGGIALSFVVIACLCYTLCKRQQQKKEKISDGGSGCKSSPFVQVNNRRSTTFLVTSQNNASNGYCRHFLLSEITAATNNFDDALLLGAGGYGKVYRGEIDGGTKVAIKRGDQLTEQGWCEFKNEIKMLSELHNCHLVSLIGYCIDSSEMILIFNYMANGTLCQHLYGTNRPPLSWRRRLDICIGAAKGLHYLHSGGIYKVIHRDVKTTNILLDENWVAKVSDFGISRMTPSMDCSHVSTLVKGTFGYFDPEYFRTKRLTEKSDVYSFGVVLLEVLCARPALDVSCPSVEMNLARWAAHHQRNGGLNDIMDPFLRGKIAAECLQKFVQVAEKCLAERGENRPSMANVLMDLELALRLQLQAEEANEKVSHTIFVENCAMAGASSAAIARRSDDDCCDNAQEAAAYPLNQETSANVCHNSALPNTSSNFSNILEKCCTRSTSALDYNNWKEEPISRKGTSRNQVQVNEASDSKFKLCKNCNLIIDVPI